MSTLQLPRFYPILDSELLQRRELGLIPAAEGLLDAGARILQLRHKTHFSRDVFDQAERIARIVMKGIYIIIVKPAQRRRYAPVLGRVCNDARDLVRLQTRGAERYQTDRGNKFFHI